MVNKVVLRELGVLLHRNLRKQLLKITAGEWEGRAENGLAPIPKHIDPPNKRNHQKENMSKAPISCVRTWDVGKHGLLEDWTGWSKSSALFGLS